MTELTDEAVTALLDGATPGPWVAEGDPQNRIVWSADGNRVCFMAHSSGLNDDCDIATSNLTAAAPDLARALLDARAELAATQTQVGDWIVRADEANVKVETLEAELARVKADAAAAVALVIINLESDLLDRVLEGSVWSMPEGTHTTDEWGRGVTDARRDIAAAVRATFADIADNDGLAMVSEPHDPGDGWTWNERLGWIGPDGKPADPRMRG